MFLNQLNTILKISGCHKIIKICRLRYKVFKTDKIHPQLRKRQIWTTTKHLEIFEMVFK